MLVSDSELTPREGSCLNKQVTVCRNNASHKSEGKVLYISPSSTLQGFLKDAGNRLGMETEASRLYTEDGEYLDDISFVNNRDVLYVLDEKEEFEPESKNYLGNYTLGKFLGQGSFGKVHIGIHKRTDEKVALKFLRKDSLGSFYEAERVFTEVQCLNSLDHPNVISLFEVLDTSNFMVLAFEYASGGDLRDYVQAQPGGYLAEEDAARLFVQILDGVAYCHRHHVIHYDLKLENILLVPKSNSLEPVKDVNHEDKPIQLPSVCETLVIKIADFGLSQVCQPGKLDRNYHAGSIAYIPPEVWGENETAGPPRDVWAIGVILFAMLCGKLPFNGKTREQVMRRAERGKYKFKAAETISDAAKQIVASMLQPDPRKRKCLSELRLTKWLDKGQAYTRALDRRASDIAAAQKSPTKRRNSLLSSSKIEAGYFDGKEALSDEGEESDGSENQSICDKAKTDSPKKDQEEKKIKRITSGDKSLDELHQKLEIAISRHVRHIEHPPKAKTPNLSRAQRNQHISRRLKPISCSVQPYPLSKQGNRNVHPTSPSSAPALSPKYIPSLSPSSKSMKGDTSSGIENESKGKLLNSPKHRNKPNGRSFFPSLAEVTT